MSFAFISVAVGIFGTYDDVLKNAGPVGIWLWPVVAVGQTLIALVIAQFAARIPLSGSSYQWASRLANPKVGWFFGWLSFCYLVIGVVAVDNALAKTALMPLLGMPDNQTTARVITVVMMILQAVLVIASTRLVGLLTSAAVGLELIIVVVLTVALFIAVAVTGQGSAGNLTSRGITDGAPDYFSLGGGLMAAMIMGIATLVGFDAAANMAEEAKDPFRNVPRAIVGSVVAAGLLGMVFAVALTIAIKDIPAATDTDSPVALILRDQLGVVMERFLLVAIVIAFFGAGMVTLATCARMVFAMARDDRFPAPKLMQRVSPRTHTPIPATVPDRRAGDRPDRWLCPVTRFWSCSRSADSSGPSSTARSSCSTWRCESGWGARRMRSTSAVSRYRSPSRHWCGRRSWWPSSSRRPRHARRSSSRSALCSPVACTSSIC